MISINNPEFLLSKLKAFQIGLIYGLELSSAACAFSLNPEPSDHILDLCCCPGSKLSYIMDLMI